MFNFDVKWIRQAHHTTTLFVFSLAHRVTVIEATGKELLKENEYVVGVKYQKKGEKVKVGKHVSGF